MNRVVLLGVAVFLAVVGIALLGGANSALAGHGCCGCCGGCNGCYGGCCGGCNGGYGGCCGGCHGGYDCGGCHGGCGGYAYNGNAQGGSYAMRSAPQKSAPAPVVAQRTYRRVPVGYRRISFRR